MKIAIVGAGAIGGTLAAWLSRRPDHDLTLCVRTPITQLVVNTPDSRIEAYPTILTDPKTARPVDWVLLCVKNYDVPAAAGWLAGLVGEGTRVAVVQNGVEQVYSVLPYLPGDIVLPVVLDVPAGKGADGVITQNRLGWVAVPDTPSGADFVALFGRTGLNVATDPDWLSTAWGKLCHNCAGAFATLTLQAPGPRWNDRVAAMIRGSVEECLAVARAEGAELEDAVVDRVVEGQRSSQDGGGLNSMAEDRARGRTMEVAARNGVICRLGREHGIPTPVNDLMVTLLEASQP